MAEHAIQDMVTDELMKDVAMYHLQQAVEKSLKAWINFRSKEYKRTHDIKYIADILVNMGEPVPNWVISKAELLTKSEAATRYSESLFIVRSDAIELYPLSLHLAKKVEGLVTSVIGEIDNPNNLWTKTDLIRALRYGKYCTDPVECESFVKFLLSKLSQAILKDATNDEVWQRLLKLDIESQLARFRMINL